MNSYLRKIVVVSLVIITATGSLPLQADDEVKSNEPARLRSQFTTSTVLVDGEVDRAWNAATPSLIGIKMKGDLSAAAPDCTTHGQVRSLWDGNLLYLLIEVDDANISTAGTKDTDKDGVDVYIDFWNDKFAKYLEDDWRVRISSEGELSARGAYQDRLKAFATAVRYNDKNEQVGYTVELAIYTGGLPAKNGSLIGLELSINDASTTDNLRAHRICWYGLNRWGLDNNTGWGEIELLGYDEKGPKHLSTYLLDTAIKTADSLSHGIWISETQLDQSLANARNTQTSPSQSEIDEAAAQLDQAIKALRRRGHFPDPYELPSLAHLPDPFSFINGNRVESPNDWAVRTEEIKSLAQYYEYGTMPKAPKSVSIKVEGTQAIITVHEKSKAASFDAILTLPTLEQCGKKGPYPVIVSIDFRPGEANPIYLNSGYAVLSIIYSSVASDNDKHEGAFYELYPYYVVTGNDAGTLLAWAWGASRGVDALEYLSENNPEYANAFDLSKLVVTGFSRCGKATLLAGMMDDRFGVVSPGASGCGGAAVYRYQSFNNDYSWGKSYGCEVLGDKIRHQGHNSNEMLSRFLNQNRIYSTDTHGYGNRLPYDHHEIIATIAPRAVMITTANDDYANGSEGDCIALEGAKPVFKFLGVPDNLALNIRTSGEEGPWGGGHWLDDNQIQNLVTFSNKIFYGESLSQDLRKKFYTNPYLQTIDTYYGGLETVMPWSTGIK